jgi:Protein of unknown function (DUF3768)
MNDAVDMNTNTGGGFLAGLKRSFSGRCGRGGATMRDPGNGQSPGKWFQTMFSPRAIVGCNTSNTCILCGVAVMTPGIAALGEEAVARIVKTIAVFDDFCHANDPHEEHDFGSFEAEGHTIFFKIDYFDRNLKYHSPDPADPGLTVRVITIMLADEY